VDNERVSNTSEWGRLLRRHDSGTVKVNVMRDRREQTLSLTLPEQSSDGGNSFVIDMPDMEQLQVELQNLGPALSRQQTEVQARVQRELAAHQKEIQKAMRDAQREIERSMRELERERVRERDNED